jgi:hypothetical protein
MCAAVALCSILILVVRIGLNAFFSKPSRPAIAGWGDIDAGQYRSMERLLKAGDFAFLAANGYSATFIRRLRAERCSIFRGYLKSMSTDFAGLCSAIRLLAVESDRPRPDLLSSLLRAQATFTWLRIAVEWRLALHRLGWTGISIDVRPLVAALDQMRVVWQELTPAPMAA